MNANNRRDYNLLTDITDNDNTWTAQEFSGKKQGALDAHWGTKRVYDYWLNEHNRNGFDNAGSPLLSVVHYGDKYDNAFWNGINMTYGDGSWDDSTGTGYFDIFTSLDIVAHEIGHGVTEHTSGLYYRKESGALNESFSDIWGAVIEHYAKGNGNSTGLDNSVWLMGDEMDKGYTGSGIRSMRNPKSKGHPDTYGGRYWQNPNCSPSGYNDYCGVHTNSGVLNHAFYILTEGKNGVNDNGSHYSVSGVGVNVAAEIAYNASLLLTPNSNYADCRNAFVNTAQMLYPPQPDGSPSLEEIAVRNAFHAVGVGGRYACDTIFSNVALLSPLDGATDVTEPLKWTDNDVNASIFEVQVATDSAFTNIIDSAEVFTPVYGAKNLLSHQTYYWRVKPKNDCGEGSFSTVYRFSTGDLSYVHIPDTIFKNALITQGVDQNWDGEIQFTEAEAVTHLGVALYQKNIEDLTGIEAFVNLMQLHCGKNQLTALDISNNLKLTKLSCYDNQISSIDVSEHIHLEELWVSNNQLSSIDISNNPRLWVFSAYKNQFSSIDLSSNTLLESISLSDNQLSNVDLSNNIKLRELSIYGNQLSSIDLSGHLHLQSLSIGNNNLSNIDLSNNPSLESLSIFNNQLSSIDVLNNPDLKRLWVSSNQLSNIDVSNNLKLEDLWVHRNRLLNLYLSNNTSLWRLYCYDNQLESLNIANGNNSLMTALKAQDNPALRCIKIDSGFVPPSSWQKDLHANYNVDCSPVTYIPDNSFVAALNALGMNTNAQGLSNHIYDSEAASIVSLDLSNAGISDLTGIEAFTNLTILLCHDNQLTDLNVSGNSELNTLWCWGNQLDSLDLAQNTDLEYLLCHNNQLTDLDVSNNQALRYLRCGDNQLTSLDVSNNLNLVELSCNANQLTSLDVSQNAVLQQLNCNNNQLSTLIVSNGNNGNIHSLDARSNYGLTCIQIDHLFLPPTTWYKDSQTNYNANCALPVTYVPDTAFVVALNAIGMDTNAGGFSQSIYNHQADSIISLAIAGAGISDLTGIEAFTNLIDLNCSGNQLSVLDLSHNLKLKELKAENNQLTNLDLGNPDLEMLWLRNNQLANIDLSGSSSLEQVLLDNNQLVNIDLVGNPNLKIGWLRNNQLDKIDVSQNLFLKTLLVSGNQLQELDVSQNNDLQTLYCGGNLLNDLDVSHNPILTTLLSNHNQLESLNVANGNNGAIGNFRADGNPDLYCIRIDQGFTPSAGWNKDPWANYSSNCGVSSGINIYPNPASNVVTVNLGADITQLTIEDSYKNVMQTISFGTVSKGEHLLDVSKFRSGIYFLRFKLNDGTERVERLIVK